MVAISRTAYYYEPNLNDDSKIIYELNALTEKYHRWGFPKCFNRLRKLGVNWNHKRVYRVLYGAKIEYET